MVAVVMVVMVHLVVGLDDGVFMALVEGSYRPGEVHGGDVVLAAPDDFHMITT